MLKRAPRRPSSPTVARKARRAADHNRALAVACLEQIQKKRATRTIHSAEQTKFQREFLAQFAERMGWGTDFPRWFEQQLSRARRRMPSRYENPGWFMLLDSYVEKIKRQTRHSPGIVNRKEILFGSLATGDVNGAAVRFENPDYAIVLLDDGIMTFANLLAKAMMQMLIMDPDAPFGVDIKASWAMLHRIPDDSDAFTRFAEIFLHYAVNGSPDRAPHYDPARDAVAVISDWRGTMEYFVLGHEFGHVRLGHLDEVPTAPISHDGYEQIAIRWEREFEADRFGLRVACDCEEGSKAVVCVGAVMFLHGLQLLGRTLAAFLDVPDRDGSAATHPSYTDRITNLWREAGQILQAEERAAAIELGALIETLYQQLWPLLRDQIAIQRAEGHTPHGKWLVGSS